MNTEGAITDSYNITHGVEKVFFSPPSYIRIWVHPVKVKGSQLGREKRKFFAKHVIMLWNLLPPDVMVATGFESHKRG